ncbi:MAG: CTP synthase, partial [Patescibacteria group bacterium]
PTEHGEVFVLDDGMECDQDMGNYERFLDRNLTKNNYMTTGSIYQTVINRERSLAYKGKCVEVVPHIPLEVLDKIKSAAHKNKAEIAITEIGGTVGEYQNILFLEAVRMLKLKNPSDVLLVLVSYLPFISAAGELKTKPTQYAVKTLNYAGLQPDIIIARTAFSVDKKRKEKIAFNCGLKEEEIISASDVDNIYKIPINFEKDNLSAVITKKLNIKPRKKDLKEWKKFIVKTEGAKGTVKIGIAGKYFTTGDFILTDSYISIIEAIKHATYFFEKRPIIEWLNVEEFSAKDEKRQDLSTLEKFDGIIVPGGFGDRGVEEKIAVINYCRKKQIPYLGICYGMQLAIVEYARNAARLKDAHTTEVNPKTPHPVIDILPEQKNNLSKKDYGGTMRLGAYHAQLKKGSIAQIAYNSNVISERHRHRFEVNPDYINKLERAGV